MAGADLVTSLRRAGVNRGDLVALVISPALATHPPFDRRQSAGQLAKTAGRHG